MSLLPYILCGNGLVDAVVWLFPSQLLFPDMYAKTIYPQAAADGQPAAKELSRVFGWFFLIHGAIRFATGYSLKMEGEISNSGLKSLCILSYLAEIVFCVRAVASGQGNLKSLIPASLTLAPIFLLAKSLS
eukprot:g21750.t1